MSNNSFPITSEEIIALFHDVYCTYYKDGKVMDFGEYLANHCNVNDTYEEVKEQLEFALKNNYK